MNKIQFKVHSVQVEFEPCTAFFLFLAYMILCRTSNNVVHVCALCSILFSANFLCWLYPFSFSHSLYSFFTYSSSLYVLDIFYSPLCSQLGEWVFIASGTGLLPQTQDPVSVYTVAGSNTTLIIPFRNPMDNAVICEVLLRGK